MKHTNSTIAAPKRQSPEERLFWALLERATKDFLDMDVKKERERIDAEIYFNNENFEVDCENLGVDKGSFMLRIKDMRRRGVKLYDKGE